MGKTRDWSGKVGRTLSSVEGKREREGSRGHRRERLILMMIHDDELDISTHIFSRIFFLRSKSILFGWMRVERGGAR